LVVGVAVVVHGLMAVALLEVVLEDLELAQAYQ